MKNLLIVLAAIALVLLFVFTRSFNTLVIKAENIKTKWEQVKGPLERRNDLIRDLVNTVRGIVKNEEIVLDELNALRSQWPSLNTINEKLGAASAMDTALSRLLKAAENYSELKGKEAFAKVIHELTGVENRIAIEKTQYNEAARNYNIKVRNMPSSIIASLFGYKLAAEYPNVQ